jgi:Tfp pilus assembly protein PilF
MATHTPPETATTTPARPADPPRRPLWQAPLFVLGAAALAGMALARPFAPASPTQRVARDLERTRDILARPDGSGEEAARLARAALEDADQDHLADAAYLLGWAQQRIAEKAEPDAAAEAWKRSRQYLEQALHAGVSARDAPALHFRLGRAGFHTHGEVGDVIGHLRAADAGGAADRAEIYRLLATAYHRLVRPPDLARALEYNQKLRDIPEISEADLADAKLQGGELLLALGKPEEARRTLEKISEKAAPAVLTRSRLLRARCHQAEKQYNDAVTLYALALADQRASIPEPAQVYYNLGLCYKEKGQREEAEKAWRRCLELARGEEAQAAGVVLAGLRLLEKDDDAPAEALATLTGAVAGVNRPQDWTNKLVDLGTAVAAFERAADVFRERGKYDLAMRLLEPYARLAPPFKVLLLRGDVAAEWAGKQHEQDRLKPDPALKQGVRDLSLQAAGAYAEAAASADLSLDDRARYLWQSATAYMQAEDPGRAAEQFEKYVKLNLKPAELGEAYFRLGELRRNDKAAAAAARAAFEKCMTYDTPYVYTARYQLALMDREAGKVDDAEARLVENFNALPFVQNLEAVAPSVFALGNLLYNKRDYRRAARYLATGLNRIQERKELFKDNAEVTQARYQLADSYRQIARQEVNALTGEALSEDKKEMHQREYRRNLELAAAEFEALDAYLNSPAGAGQLSREQRARVPLDAARCWKDLGQYDKALAGFDTTFARFPNQQEGLDALGGAVSCHAALGHIDQVRGRLLQIKTLLEQMPPEVRTPWEAWLQQAVKNLNDAERSGPRSEG